MKTKMSDIVKVSRRFTRSVRVDMDISDPAALDGYICPHSAIESLLSMLRHREATRHSAFTWTGPYGSGKSSLAVALVFLLRGEVSKISGTLSNDPEDGNITELIEHFRRDEDPWRVCAVVGQRADAETVIGDAINAVAPTSCERTKGQSFAAWVGQVAEEMPGPGLAIIIDEMGKFLEHAAIDRGDIHVFQELAEISSRSGGRLLIVGILHQAFDEYAQRLSRESRDEWLKIQGRFVDLSVNLAADEQIELIARAIEAPAHKPRVDAATRLIASTMRAGREKDSARLAGKLASCWPLHPLAASLLGPISRRRFGQSQRSIFGFLTSAEPHGFQEFLASTRSLRATFGADQLWDYLRANLESAILASPDGHRWSTAVDAIERCETRSGTPSHMAAIKVIALLDLFKDRSGLQPTRDIVRQGAGIDNDEDWDQIARDLIEWSLIVFRKHTGAYAVYAGSDFDIELAIDDARSRGIGTDFKLLEEQSALRPALAKRHYEEKGALRWFEVGISAVCEAEDRVKAYTPAPGSAGLFLILLSSKEEPEVLAKRIASAAVQASSHLVMAGWTRDSFRLRNITSDLAALEYIRAEQPSLEGDAVARREIDARIARLTADLDDRLREALDQIDWCGPVNFPMDNLGITNGPAALSVLASRLADWRFPETPKLHNELINRTKPSGSAAGAIRLLLHAMVEHRGHERLGLVGFPPEAGLFVSLLLATGLYRIDDSGQYSFNAPVEGDAHALHSMWSAIDVALQQSEAGLSFAEIYNLWRQPPYGVRDGLLPVMALAYVLTRAGRTSLYLDDVFRPQLDTFFVDRLLQDPSMLRARDMDLTSLDTSLIAHLSDTLGVEAAIEPNALAVAKAIVTRVRSLPNWTQRTTMLSTGALELRNLGLRSHDPSKMLFEDLPRKLAGHGRELADAVGAALHELNSAYTKMLGDLAATLFSELRYDPTVDESWALLYTRCETVRGLSGNFRLDALATRLGSFTGEITDVEGIASLAANKPSRDWVDRDIDAAKIELAALAQQFLRAEGLAHLKGRGDKQTSMAVYISDPSYPAPISPHIELNFSERARAQDLAVEFGALIERAGVSPTVAFGAIACLGLSLASTLNEYSNNEEDAGS